MSRDERVEAATRSFWGIEPGHQLSAARNTRMGIALTASDALLRTDEAVERVARAIRTAGAYCGFCDYEDGDQCDECVETTDRYARAAITALLGEGE